MTNSGRTFDTFQAYFLGKNFDTFRATFFSHFWVTFTAFSLTLRMSHIPFHILFLPHTLPVWMAASSYGAAVGPRLDQIGPVTIDTEIFHERGTQQHQPFARHTHTGVCRPHSRRWSPPLYPSLMASVDPGKAIQVLVHARHASTENEK